jgi:hypothetical protein
VTVYVVGVPVGVLAQAVERGQEGLAGEGGEEVGEVVVAGLQVEVPAVQEGLFY